jgi:hypothetical protein
MTVTNTATPVPLDSTNERLHRKQLAAALNRASEHNSKISVQVDNNTASITTEQTVRATADSALADSITTLTATVNSNTAAISTEQTARVNGDTALASSITTLTATVNGNTAAISTEATARATADGNIMADYTLQVSTLANGKKALAGLKLIAGSNQSSEVDVIASKFNVYDDILGVTHGGPVFTVDASGVKITGALYAGSITTDQLTVGGTLITASLLASNSVGTSQIVNNAAVVPYSWTPAGTVNLVNSTTLWTSLWNQNVVISSAGAATVLFNWLLSVSYPSGGTSNFRLRGVTSGTIYATWTYVIGAVTFTLPSSEHIVFEGQGNMTSPNVQVLANSYATLVAYQKA